MRRIISHHEGAGKNNEDIEKDEIRFLEWEEEVSFNAKKTSHYMYTRCVAILLISSS